MKKLRLNKKVISKLNSYEMNHLKGGIFDEPGYDIFTSGCTDGCTTSNTFQSAWRCTKSGCTADCTDTPRTTM